MENTDVQETEIETGTIEQDVQEEVIEKEETEKPVESAEIGEPEKEEVAEPAKEEDPQDAINKRINKIHREKKEAEERETAERARREEVEAKLKELQKVEIKEIPDIPDYFDPDYTEKMAERDKIIAEHAQEQSRKIALAQIESDKAVEAQREHVKNIENMAKTFDDNTKELGLDKTKLAESQNVVGSYIKGKQSLAQYLLSDENGPLNVQYLSQNLAELEKVGAMNEAQAAVYIATKVTPEAQKLKPKTTNAPEPPYEPSGKANPIDEHPALKGATFE